MAKKPAPKAKAPEPTLQLGPITVTSGQQSNNRIALLLWGPSSAGKTTFAATAPGKKLWLSMGDNEHVTVANRDDVLVADTSGLGLDDLFRNLQSDNPMGLDNVLATNEDIATVVFDSVTALTFRALQKSVQDKVGGSKTFTPTMEAPGQSAYGGRNAIVLSVLTGLLRVTAKHNVHIILTAHEGDPVTKSENGKEIIDYISLMLGGQLVNNVTYRLSEIWHLMQSTGKRGERYLTTRSFGMRRPMKSRMFDSMGIPRFELQYDANKPDDAKGQMTIAGWYNQWVDGGYAKLPVPTTKTNSSQEE